MAETKMRVENLFKVFGDQPDLVFSYVDQELSREEIRKRTGQTVALRDINFDVKEGEVFVVMGLSGSGKSTLLRCINRLIEPTSGKVILEPDTDVTQLSYNELIAIRKKYFGMVFQSFALLSTRTVLSNVGLGLEIQNVSENEITERSKESLKLVGLEGWEDSYISELSGGMQQRVGLARALAVDPEILFMDEPFSALDPLIRVKMQEELIRIQHKMKKTIIFITHDLHEAVKLGDRIAILDKEGKAVQIDPPENILLHPSDEYVKSFVQELDVPSVLTIVHLAKHPESTINPNDSPQKALESISDGVAFVLDEDKVYQGIVTEEDAQKAKEANSDTIKDYIKEKRSLDYNRTINEVAARLFASKTPLVAVDNEGKFMGYLNQKAAMEVMEGEESI